MDRLRIMFVTSDLEIITEAHKLMAKYGNHRIVEFSHSAELPKASDFDVLVADSASFERFAVLMSTQLYTANLYNTDFLVVYTADYADTWRHLMRLSLQKAPFNLSRNEAINLIYATNGLEWLSTVTRELITYTRFNQLLDRAKRKLSNNRRIALFY